MKYLYTMNNENGNLDIAFTKGFAVDLNSTDDTWSFNLTENGNDDDIDPKDVGFYLKSIDDMPIEKIKILDAPGVFKDIQNLTFKGHNGVILDDMYVAEGAILKELLFYKNNLYLVLEFYKGFFIYKGTIPETEEIKSNLPSEDIIKFLINKRKLEIMEDVTITLINSEKGNKKYVTLEQLFGFPFRDVELYIYNKFFSSKKVNAIYLVIKDAKQLWDESIEKYPLIATHCRYCLVLEDGQEVYMFWTDLNTLLNNYLLAKFDPENSNHKEIYLHVPNFYQY